MSTTIRVPARAPRAEGDDADAGDEHRERREHERRARGSPRRPTSSVASPPPPNAIAMIGIIVSGSAVPDRREHGPDGPLGELELAAEPLDAVGEQLGAQQDDDEGDGEDEQVHLSLQADGGHDRTRGRRGARRARPGRAAVARGDEPDARDDDPPDAAARSRARCPAHRNPSGLPAAISAGIGRSSNGGTPPWASGSMPRGEHQHDADERSGPSRGRCRRRAAARSSTRGATRRRGRPATGSTGGWTRRSQAHRLEAPSGRPCTSSTTTNSTAAAGCRSGGRAATPTDAPTNTPSATGPAMYGSISSRSR